MKLFLKSVGVFVAIQMVILFVVLLRYPSQGSTYLEATLDKHAWLAESPQPRLILAGGSNITFGIDSQMISEHLPLSPVNLALHGSLGSDFMLNEAASDLRTGDVVVVSLEYDHFVRDTTDMTLADLLEHRPESAAYLSTSQKKLLLDQGFVYLRRVLRRAVKGKQDKEEGGVYDRTSFNRYGDMVAHHDEKPNRRKMLGDSPLRVSNPKRMAHVIDSLNELESYCRQRGARMFYFYPPIPPSEAASLVDVMREVQTEMTAKGAAPQLNTPFEVIYPLELFFDTRYHLALDGKIRRTELLIERLSDAMELAPEDKEPSAAQ